MNSYSQLKMQSKKGPLAILGPLYLVASEKGLRGVFWNPQPVVFLDSKKESSKAAIFLRQGELQLLEYLRGKRQKFQIRLDLQGTELQKKVWLFLTKSQYGQTTTYSKLAESVDSRAVRAVASANAKNPLAIIVPCHRTIGVNGKLCGYSGGLEKKSWLLEMEVKNRK